MIAAAVLFAATTAAVVRTFRTAAPGLPPLDGFGPLAPEIQDIVRQARDGVAQDPRDGLRWGRFGMVCEANGLTAAARDAYAAAAQAQPSEAKWRFHLAVVDARLGRTDDAVREIGRAIELNPTYAPAFWRLGLWLLDQNQVQAAERAFKRSTDIDPADRSGWIGLARVYLQRDELERAAGLLERLAASGPSDGYTLQLLGTAYERLGRLDQAATALQVGAKGEPQWNDPWTNEMLEFRRGYAALLRDATAYVVAGQFPRAIAILEQLRRDRPDDLVLMAHLGQVYVAAGRDSDGVALLERVLAVQPDRFEALVDLATGYMHQGNLQKARAAAERAVSLNGSFAPARETLGLILARLDDPRGAIASLETAVRLDPRNARALVWMGMVQTNAGRGADALAAFERAAQVDPTNVDAWIGIAHARMNARQLNAAADALRNAQRLQPDRPIVNDTMKRLQAMQAEGTPARNRRNP